MNLIEFTQKLLRIQSITPRDMGCFDLIEPELKELGFSTKRINYLNVENLYAEIGSGENFCFLGHTDVVPTGPVESWSCDPFAAEIKENVITARGAADMKSSISAFLFALKDIDLSKNRKKISILLTSNEEGDAKDGTIEKVLDELKQNNNAINYCLAGEPSSKNELGDTVRIGRRGSLSGSLTIVGKQGHVAYPNRANNPSNTIIKILKKIKEIKLDNGTKNFQASNLEITKINIDNKADNVIPGDAYATFNIRFNDKHSSSKIKKKININLRKICKKHKCKFKIEYMISGESFITKPNKTTYMIKNVIKKNTKVNTKLSTSGGTSDARFIRKISPCLEFGMVGASMHQIDENIKVRDLKTLTKIHKEILENYFS